MSLKQVYSILEDLCGNPSRLAKESIIDNHKNDELFKKVVYYAYNPFLRFNVTSVDYVDRDPDVSDDQQTVENIFNMLDYLAGKNGATDQDRWWLNQFASIDYETADVVRRIVKKDLECGANVKTFKKFFPNIPIHEVMLCIDDIPKFLIAAKKWSNIVWSVKLDGVRCWAVIQENGSVSYLSRNGKTFPNFSVFDASCVKAAQAINAKYQIPYPIILDGEVVAKVVDSEKSEDFQKLMTQVRRLSNVNKDMFEFDVFDVVVDDIPFMNRYEIIMKTIDVLKLDDVKVLRHYYTEFKDAKDLVTFADEYCAKGHEGIVFKTKDGLYEYKRSKLWLKVKKMYTIDCRTTRWEYGTGRNSRVMGTLYCMYEKTGKEFGVGSGFNDDERVRFMTDTPQIIEVKYQEITKDGVPRFPVFVRSREDKNEVD